MPEAPLSAPPHFGDLTAQLTGKARKRLQVVLKRREKGVRHHASSCFVLFEIYELRARMSTHPAFGCESG